MFKLKNMFKRKTPPPPVAPEKPGHRSSSGDSTTLEISFQKQLNVSERGGNGDGSVRVIDREAGSTSSDSNEPSSHHVQTVQGKDGTSQEEDTYDESSDATATPQEEPEDVFPEQAELKDYMLIQKIGEGAFSKVYRGIPSTSNCSNGASSVIAQQYKEVAIKVIIKQQLPNTNKKGDEKNGKTSTAEQVLKEIAIHKIVSSGENIVSFIDFQESEKYYYIIQELLAGGEIFGEIVKYTYFSEDLSRHVIRQLANAVKYMHQLGIVHRDIKPENLLFEPIDFIPNPKPKLRSSDDPSTKLDEGVFRPGIGGGGIGVVKLADFGLSKQIYQTNTKTPCGTVGYTAPEVVKDERYSMQVDMWGVGCVLYTVLCGFPPFFDEKIDVLTEKISRGEYTFLRPWWDQISDGAKNCVRKLLEVDPAKRYTSEQLLQDPWLNSYDCLPSADHSNAPSTGEKRRHSHKHSRKAYKKNASLLYSPAAVAMRDAFDVSNAVQRIEDDKRMTPGPKNNYNNNLGVLAEDAEAEIQYREPFTLKLDSSSIIKRRRNNV
ncbi:Rck2/Rck1 [Kluyveromyces lactis]|nr:Rck2/Rck1 [Kluyveromyces lactis]